MNKLIEDMERLGTKRVPDRFIQRERAPGWKPFYRKTRESAFGSRSGDCFSKDTAGHADQRYRV